MIAIVLLGLLACAGASPRWHRHHPPAHPSPFDDSFERYLNEDIFDTNRFWDEFSRNLERDMRQMTSVLENFGRRFPSVVSSEGIEGDNYKITIPLNGFLEKEIIVKASKGVLMIQAVHDVKGEPQNNYLDIRTLPACVSEAGNWSYEKGVLTVILPLIKNGDGDGDTEVIRRDPLPDHSREETDKTNVTEDSVDPDVGANAGRGDIDDRKILTNQIPNTDSDRVEATTYAVDLKGEYEFVPLRGSNS